MRVKVSATFKAVLSAVLAIAAALLVRHAYIAVAASAVGGVSSQFEDRLLEARNMFVEKADDIQTLTASLLEGPAISIMRSSDGLPMLTKDGEAAGELRYEDQGAQKSLEAVFGEYKSGGTVWNIEVKEDAALFYTYYKDGGCAGFLYEKEPGTTSYYGYFDLLENWKLFYLMPK
jgi:hypothetical protein